MRFAKLAILVNINKKALILFKAISFAVKVFKFNSIIASLNANIVFFYLQHTKNNIVLVEICNKKHKSISIAA